MREGWVPDGRAGALRADCEASLEALDGRPIDLYLVHAPDPRTPWPTTVRALARLCDEGLVAHIGVSNVNLRQLDEALALAPLTAVQAALSARDDRAVRGGLLDRCVERGLTLIAHSPLGGPRRKRLTFDEAETELASLLALAPNVVAIPGARRPETARSAARAATRAAPASRGPRQRARPTGAEVVLVMGIPGAGKSRLAAGLEGSTRLNRDERGGTLREVADELDRRLAGGETRVVLDNTYLTRASRSYVLDAAARRGAEVRCIWLDTPLAQAQVNLVERLLDRFGRLPEPDELRAAARKEQGLLLPTSQLRALRELEEPSADEGFAAVERVPFVRGPWARSATAVFVAAPALDRWSGSPDLVFDWRPDAAGQEGLAICPHGGGPPACWCRPPLPGLLLAFARAHDVDPGRSTVVGCRPAHRTLAETLGATYVEV
jgi:predicted kinase